MTDPNPPIERNLTKYIYTKCSPVTVVDTLTQHLLKAEVLSIVKDSTLDEHLFNELLEVVRLFIDDDFPQSWPELTKNYFDNCISHLFEAC